jgi:aspartate/methionine/tyrosine aminotransferase
MVESGRRKIAERIRSLKPSATVEMTERIRAARAGGRRIIGLSSGDPNIDTDPRIIEAAEHAMRAGQTHYSTPAGETDLREAIAAREMERAGVTYGVADIIVTPGGKFALLTALMAVVEAGDEVLVPEPGWVSYGPCVRLCGGTPVPIPMLDCIEPAQLEAAVTDRTRAIVINSPVNPTGRMLRPDDLSAIIDLAKRYDLWIVFDQVYSDLVYAGAFPYPQGMEGGMERTLVVDSLSKSFGMTGWRLGYLALPPDMAKYVVKLIQHSVYCVPAFVQAAGTMALSLRRELVPRYRAVFHKRLQRAARELNTVEGIACAVPDATFYLFPRVTGDDADISRRWLEEIDIAVVPGSAFGAAGKGHLRLSLTCTDQELERALERIAQTGIGTSREAGSIA